AGFALVFFLPAGAAFLVVAFALDVAWAAAAFAFVVALVFTFLAVAEARSNFSRAVLILSRTFFSRSVKSTPAFLAVVFKSWTNLLIVGSYFLMLFSTSFSTSFRRALMLSVVVAVLTFFTSSS